MAAFTKYQQFAYDLSEKVHNLNADSIALVLSNTAPNVATNKVLADAAEIAGGNGYTAGGTSVTPVGATSGGTFTLSGTNVTWTAAGGNIAAFEYVILLNLTPSSPLKPLMGYWDYGSALTLNGTNGDSFTVKFNGGASSGTILTVA